MLFPAVQPHQDSPSLSEAGTLPAELVRLFPRERELALIVYRLGLATAIDVERSLADPLSNAAVRTILNRLAAKGILARQKCRGRRLFLYAPALTEALALERTTRILCNDLCGGSLAALAQSVSDEFMARSGLCSPRPGRGVLPEHIRALAPALREVATIIYQRGGATISQIQSHRRFERTFAGARACVYELIKRRIVVRRPNGRAGEFIYLPALITEPVIGFAVDQWLADHFDGSPSAALKFLLQLIEIDRLRSKEPLRPSLPPAARTRSKR